MSFYDKFAYEASAGSGKTFALVSRYISLLFLGANPSQILALTFTNKAANEMSGRILKVLKELHLPSRVAELNDISEITGITTDDILDSRELVLKRFLGSDLKISTIDKFFASILRKFSLYEGIMPDFLIEESGDEVALLRNFISNLKKSGEYKNSIEFAAFEEKKHTNFIDIFERLYERDGELRALKVEDIGEEAFKLERLVLDQAKALQALFFSCEELSTTARKSLTFETIDELLDKSWIQRDTLNYRTFSRCFSERADEYFIELKGLLRHYLRAKEHALLSKYFDIYDIYKESKRELHQANSLLRFNDISYYVNKLLNGRVDSDFLYFRLDSQISHLLIDEFQDTNILQYLVLKPIIDEISSGVGVNAFRSLFYVGDIKQSIYRFRGGAKELFYYIAKKYGVHVEKLNRNYRSKREVVEFVNETFKTLIPSYTEQLANDCNGGLVKVVEGEDHLSLVLDEVFTLLENGVSEDDIAILVFSNDDATLIREMLLDREPHLNVQTESSMKLIKDRLVMAVIEFLKYLYFGDELYLINFKTAIGKSYDEEIDSSKFSKDMELGELIKKVILHFELYDRDDNLLKLLEVASNYEDIESFLFESENLSTDAPSKESRGIKILTVHKSKGLEFGHVIVADRTKRRSYDRSPMLFEYDEITLKNIYIKFKQREFVDDAYQRAKEREEQLSAEDEINLLYVAFTRAKESLIICQKAKNSAFERLGLVPLERGKLEVQQKREEAVQSEEFTYQSVKVGAQDVKNLDESENRNDIAAVNYGIAMHYMLEMLDGFEESSLERAYWAMKSRHEIYLQEGETLEIRSRVQRLLKDERFTQLIKGKAYKEQPMFYRGEHKQMDLLIERGDELIVIDYKSSKEVRASHINQVLGYKEAIKSISGKRVSAYLCYVRSGEVEWVEV